MDLQTTLRELDELIIRTKSVSIVNRLNCWTSHSLA